jgi:hypothetical protein
MSNEAEELKKALAPTLTLADARTGDRILNVFNGHPNSEAYLEIVNADGEKCGLLLNASQLQILAKALAPNKALPDEWEVLRTVGG